MSLNSGWFQMRVLILGISGMLGSSLFRFFSGSQGFEVTGTARSRNGLTEENGFTGGNIVIEPAITDPDRLAHIMGTTRPEVVINCIGIVKQLAEAKDPLVAIPVNALFPHRVAQLCALCGARMIHISTDCVFTGQKGMYVEGDPSDAEDLYGQSKYLGEVLGAGAVTLRTSIIGHELHTGRSLVDWFLSQKGETNGYRNAIFSGVPTVELAEIIRDRVIPDAALEGLYHVSADPISKHDLLQIVAQVYGKTITVHEIDGPSENRSLDSTRFRKATGYQPADWPSLIEKMYNARKGPALGNERA
jgi:dTDP-4-dehydrorhamnose reductase